MVGSEAGASGSPVPPETTKIQAKSFTCPHCGGAVTVRVPGGSLSAVCPNCKTVIDVTNENYRIIRDYQKVIHTPQTSPRIELGTRGKLKDKLWECIGFLVRSDEASAFYWHEYLLFNPYYGYRWLTLNNGHWSFVTPLRDRIRPYAAASKFVDYNDQRYRLFYTGRAIVVFVLGEFYWRVQKGYTVGAEDYISPPYMLSSERDGHEETWSLSEYISPGEIQKAFNIEGRMPEPQGIAPNQPSRWTRDWQAVRTIWIAFVVMLTIMQFIQMSSASNATVYSSTAFFVPNTKSTDTVTTPVFTLNPPKGNVQVKFNADVDNSWFWAGGELVNNKTGETDSFEQSVEYYHGYDSDGAWTEGSTSGTTLLTGIAPGDYYINFDYESGAFKDPTSLRNFSIVVTRNVPTYANYFWCLLLGSIFPIIAWTQSRAIEQRRWEDSDYSPYPTTSEY